MFKGKIYSRVMDSIKAKIEEKEVEFKEEIKKLEEQHEQNKETILNRLVSEILNKIL